MSIIQDYLDSEDLDPKTREEAFAVYSMYEELRVKLMKKETFKDKELFNITYPDIKQRY